jgi:F0F1-type ATP synthase epsilon subunit
MNTRQQLDLTVISPAKIIYSGLVDALTAVNKTGKFDVLPQHANFISLIRDQIIIYRDGGFQDRFTFKEAIIHCQKNRLHVFVGLKAMVNKRR